ncbi:hypothetical protein JYU34_013715 [Plutella xylostella]|uniref:Uncharacterized protein n=1 Tax=Plutella xylostella TaxID=51655 RepID=A0ABQ7QAG2_PLUXY|nr:hypothetical protein JYU34_013715 [Plutella xylostella]
MSESVCAVPCPRSPGRVATCAVSLGRPTDACEPARPARGYSRSPPRRLRDRDAAPRAPALPHARQGRRDVSASVCACAGGANMHSKEKG